MEGHDQRRAALTVAMLSSFLTPFMGSSVNVALKSISTEFSLNAVLESWVATSYLLSAAVFLVPFGRLADIRGRKRVFIYGLWIFSAASLLCAVAPSGYSLIGFRILQGFGSAMMFGTSIAILTSVYPPRDRGKALGLSTAVTYMGLSLGPFGGGLITNIIGWRWIFLVTVPIAALTLYVTAHRLEGEWAGAKGESFDVRGSVVYGISLTAVILGFSILPDPLGALVTGLGTLGVVVFILLERRLASPVLNMRLFSSRTFAFSNVAALINYSATFAVSFLMALYLEYVKGFSPERAGLILISQPIVMAVVSPLSGRFSDVIEPQILASAGMAITAFGLVFLALLTATSSVVFIVFSLAFLGLGFGLFSSPNTNAVMSSVERKYYGIGAASLGTMRLVGQVLSLGIATLFIAVYVGDVEISSAVAVDFLKSFQLAFVAFAAMCFVGILPSLARGKVRDKKMVQGRRET